MIVKMRHFDLVCVASEREATIHRLREMGVAHLDLTSACGAEVARAKAVEEDAIRAVRLVQKARKTHPEDAHTRARTVEEILAIDHDREILKAAAERLERDIRRYEPYGDFDPDLARHLIEKGVDLHALGGETPLFPKELPPMRLGRMREKLARIENRLAIDDEQLAECDDAFILRKFPAIRDAIAFSEAKEILESHGAVSVLSGWIPVTKEKALLDEVSATKAKDLFERTKSLGWGILLRDPVEGETPPTLIEPPRLFAPVKALFAGLGVAPAYTESDVSVPFMCYFSLFFAMLVGDGAYGAIFLAMTLFFRKKMPRSWFILMTVFSSATVLWGVLSNTWFGAGIPLLANLPTVAWLADPSYNNMMLLCFTIGVTHLMLARIWNGVCKWPDSTAIAEFGWAGILLMMYLVTNAIVGIFAGFPTWGFYLGGISIAAVFLFSVKPSELKTRGAELGMLPLNIMSALGDIISYVRLFAVGLASVKVAENFNNMALGLVEDASTWWMKALMALAMVAILVFGHVLNLMMAGLSILVHAVRLNTLEFSNHKGITWSGLTFNPFKKNT